MANIIIASLSLLLSVTLAVFYVRDRRRAKFTLETEYVNTLLEWHEQVVVILIRARVLGGDRQSTEHKTDLACLSALIEQGRFFFPNIEKADAFGQEKPPAYRGYRNVALDFLIASHNLLQEKTSRKSDQ